MAEKTSLEKSHSKLSNFKLTMICFLSILCVSAFWVGLGLLGNEAYRIFGIVLAGAGLVLSLFFMVLIGKFTR